MHQLTTHRLQTKSYYCGHPTLTQVIANAYFHTQHAEGAANFDAGWNPIPNSVISLVGAAVSVVDCFHPKLVSFLVQIHCALDEYSTGTFKEVKFVSQYVAEDQGITMHLCTLQAEMKGMYHNMKKHLTECVMSVFFYPLC